MYNFNEMSEYKNTMCKFDKAEHDPVRFIKIMKKVVFIF